MTQIREDLPRASPTADGAKSRCVLVVNLGSSTGKFSLFKSKDDGSLPEKPVWTATDPLDAKQHEIVIRETVRKSLQELSSHLPTGDLKDIDVVGHRVVHGGSFYSESVKVNDEVEKNIRQLETFAPIHNKLNLIGVQEVRRLLGAQTTHVAVFDTAFHSSIPERAYRYPVPYHWLQRYSIRKFGFHGISYSGALARASQMLNVDPESFTGIICHLGSGCSVVAVQNGKSIDTSMGFTPLEGLMMGTRCGSIDLGIVLEFLINATMNIKELSQALNYESGLAGVSGLANDMRLILRDAADGNPRAALAIEMFVYRLKSFIGAYFVHLKDPMALVFTGGIGEHAAEIRRLTVEGLGSIGCELDKQKNESVSGDADISSSSARIKTLVVKACEEWFIAREALRHL